MMAGAGVCQQDKDFNECGHGEMVNGKTQRYANRGLMTVVHIAEQINSV